MIVFDLDVERHLLTGREAVFLVGLDRSVAVNVLAEREVAEREGTEIAEVGDGLVEVRDAGGGAALVVRLAVVVEVRGQGEDLPRPVVLLGRRDVRDGFERGFGLRRPEGGGCGG